MKYFLTICLILYTVAASVAQCIEARDSDGIVRNTFCVGKTISFQDCDNVIDDDKEYYVYDYKGGADYLALATLAKTHVYEQPGRYKVLQIANNAGTTDTMSTVIEVKAAPEPSFTYARCANNSVSYTINDDNYDSYTLDFGDGQSVVTTAGTTITHTYTSAGSYSVILTGKFNNSECNNFSQQEVETLPELVSNATQIDKITVLQQAVSGRIQLELSNLVQGYSYVVERYTGNFRNLFEEISTVTEFNGSTHTYTLENVNTDEAVWYLVRPKDACNSSLSNSNILSSISLKLSSAEEQVTLEWNNLNVRDFETYDIYRNGTLLTTKEGSDRLYIDTDVTCGQTYAYYVIGRNVDPDGEPVSSVSTSLQTQVTSTTTPEKPYLLASFNLDNQVEISLPGTTEAANSTLTVERSINQTTYQPLAQIQALSLTDTDLRLQPVCYRATLTNACGNTSPVSNVVCPIILQTEQQLDGSVSLSWTAYRGFPDTVGQYVVEVLDETGTIVAQYPATGNSYTDRALSNDLQVLRYRIKAISKNGTGVTFSNIIEVQQDIKLFMPSAFTPNNDGLNDVLEVKGKFFNGYTLQIYNQLGSLVYEGTEADAAWNGTHKGKS
ncbi:hypothetical protein GCM10028895_04970 [Pontibacter rugosus]